MKKYFLAFATLIAALGLIGQTPAEAAKKTVVVVTPAPAPVLAGFWWSGQRDPAVAVSTAIVGGAATGAYFAVKDNGGVFGNSGAAYGVTTFGCAVISPIFTTMVVQRELTRREVWVMTANCAVPFVGGWFINSILDANPNPLWDK
jgi:hypothetical protein